MIVQVIGEKTYFYDNIYFSVFPELSSVIGVLRRADADRHRLWRGPRKLPDLVDHRSQWGIPNRSASSKLDHFGILTVCSYMCPQVLCSLASFQVLCKPESCPKYFLCHFLPFFLCFPSFWKKEENGLKCVFIDSAKVFWQFFGEFSSQNLVTKC